MSDLWLFLFISFFSLIQSIAGVGILVLGTPFLLYLNYNIFEVMSFLLPLSQVVSIINIFIIKIKYKKIINFDPKIIKDFFIYCIPSLAAGLYISNSLFEKINFNYTVAIVIILSIVFKISYNSFIITLKGKTNKILLTITGIVHGLTNSGGTILSLFMLKTKHKVKNIGRIHVHIFYFILASIQLVLLILFDYYENIDLNINYFYLFSLFIIFSIIGNIIFLKIFNIIDYLIYLLALCAGIFLLYK